MCAQHPIASSNSTCPHVQKKGITGLTKRSSGLGRMNPREQQIKGKRDSGMERPQRETAEAAPLLASRNNTQACFQEM